MAATLDSVAGKVGTFELDILMVCPFCGNENVLLDNTVTEAQVRCGNTFCGAAIKHRHDSRGDLPILRRVVKAWNRTWNRRQG